MNLGTLWTLFLSFVQIGALSIGGGYAAMPLIEEQVVVLHPWLTAAQFGDIMAIAEMTPGPVAINSATFVGIRVAGVPGAVAATLGCVLPSSAIVLLLAFLYYRFRGLSLIQGVLSALRPAVVAMIASAGVSLMLMAFYGVREWPEDFLHPDWIAVAIFAAGFFVLRRWKPGPLWVMGGAAVCGVLLYGLPQLV